MKKKIKSHAVTPDTVALSEIRERLKSKSLTAYPLKRYERDPVAYAFERLRVVDLMDHQVEILRDICAGVWGERHPRIAVSSCQKAGKSLTITIAALWFYECFEDARVFMTAAIEEQTKAVLWRELGAVLRRARAAGVDIDGRLAASPSGGLVSSDGSREIKGVKGREIESIAGLSGRLLFLIDEASALPASKAEVFDGNSIGGGTTVLTSNATKCAGVFFEAFHRKANFWQTRTVSAFDVIAWQERTGKIIPYTVNRQKVDEMRALYGEDSPFWTIRVLGKFLRNETGRCIPMHLIEEAAERWTLSKKEGPLVIGLDPAGPGDKGDETAWAFRFGNRCDFIHRRRALTTDAIAEETYALLRIHRKEGETPTVQLDAEGMIGSELAGKLRAESERRFLHDRDNHFELVTIRSSSKYVRDPSKFERVRDELIWELASWLASGGSIPPDDKLHIELYEPVWFSTPDGRIYATKKTEIRDRLGRSPDSFDALSLSVYTKRNHLEELEGDAAKQDRPGLDAYEHEVRRGRGLDPYGSGMGRR